MTASISDGVRRAMASFAFARDRIVPVTMEHPAEIEARITSAILGVPVRRAHLREM